MERRPQVSHWTSQRRNSQGVPSDIGMYNWRWVYCFARSSDPGSSMLRRMPSNPLPRLMLRSRSYASLRSNLQAMVKELNDFGPNSATKTFAFEDQTRKAKVMCS